MGKPQIRSHEGTQPRSDECLGEQVRSSGEAQKATEGGRSDRYRRRARVALCGLLGIAILVAVVVVVGVIPTAQKEGTALAAFEVPWQCTPPPQPGYPRSWEAAIQVATYCTANAVNRNLYTKIPLIGWSGVGPDMSMSLYHNSGAILSTLPLTASMGFSLGPGWRVSYSDQLVIAEGMAQITVVHEDGTQDKYVFGGVQYQAPPGVFDVLTYDAPANRYLLTHKDQSYHEFDSSGLLTKVVDAVGNELRITRSSSRINEIIDAAGRKLQFNYDGTGKLTTIVDVNTGFGGGSRTWTLTYDGNNRMQRVNDPMGYITDFGYDGYGRITAISDKRNYPAEPQHTYCLTYVTNAIYQVYDPDVSNPTCTYAPVSLNQTFATTCPPGAYMPLVKTSYTDRKTSAATWVYESVRENPSTSPNNGPLTAIEDPYQKRQTFVFTGRLLTQYRDATLPVARGWNYTYDPRGNRLTAVDPLNCNAVTMIGRCHQWTYDGYNNLTSYRDPGANMWSLYYANSTYPTLLTAITEPPDGQGNPAADTFLDYYLATPPLACNPQAPTPACKHGLLRKVTAPTGLWNDPDPKKFVTGFDYDTYGQRSVYQEGQVTPPSYVYTENYGNDARSRTTSNGWTCGASARASSVGGSGSATHNANNQLLTTSCVEVQPSYDEDPPPLPPPPPDIPKLPCTPLGLPGMCGNGAYTWFGNGLPKDQTQNVTVGQCGGGVTYTRTHTTQYDHLRQVDLATLHTTEYATPDRVFDHTPNLASATMTRVGPDGMQTFVQYDQANRVSYLRRGPAGTPTLEASYSYYDNGLPHMISYGNPTSAKTVYTYDSANRVTYIDHQNGAGATLLKLTYNYDNRDLPTSIFDLHMAGTEDWSALFTYDARGRLITEQRIRYPGSVPVKNWTYTYDQGGNRLTKTDNGLVKRRVEYTYDLSDPAGYGSKNNRLMRTKEYDTTATEVLLSTTWYFYNCSGNVTRVVTRQESSPTAYTATRLEYAKNEKAVSYVLGESWTWDGVSACGGTPSYSYVREFRYDSGRARYMTRKLNPGTLTVIAGSEVWSDYAGDEIYGDFSVSGTSVSNFAGYEPGVGSFNFNDPTSPRYHHADHLGTLRLTTNFSGTVESLRVFSAFGERVSGPTLPDRFGYVGEGGYQTHDDFPFLHVGARYYDPSSGRFLQRDPIGIRGGTNVYAYAFNLPTMSIDPTGLWTFGFGGDGTIHLGPWFLQISISISIGHSPNGGWSLGGSLDVTGGGGAGLGAGVSPSITITNAGSVEDLMGGNSSEVTIDVGIGSIGGVTSRGDNPDITGGGWSGIKVGGPGFGFAPGFRAGDTHTIIGCAISSKKGR